MMKIIFIAVAFFSLQANVVAGHDVTYSTGKYALKGELCTPKGKGPFPAVIYNHGGLGTTIGGAPSETCKALAKDGYIGFSPIRRPTRPLSNHLDDVMAAVRYVKNLTIADNSRIGIIGFSRGGMLAYQAASKSNDFKAVVIMATAMGKRGRGLDLSEADSIHAPVLALVAENDTGSHRTQGMNTLEGTKKLAHALAQAGKDVKLIVYPPYGSDGHTLFFSVGDYWYDVINFLKRHL